MCIGRWCAILSEDSMIRSGGNVDLPPAVCPASRVFPDPPTHLPPNQSLFFNWSSLMLTNLLISRVINNIEPHISVSSCIIIYPESHPCNLPLALHCTALCTLPALPNRLVSTSSLARIVSTFLRGSSRSQWLTQRNSTGSNSRMSFRGRSFTWEWSRLWVRKIGRCYR